METAQVFVIDIEEKPLLPTHPSRARRLLDTKKARVYRVVPFTIQLLRHIDNPVGAFTLGIDDGAKEVGIAVVNEQAQRVVFSGVIQLRQDVSQNMTRRAYFRHARRQRKTPYRKKRFLRKSGKGWLAPTIRQKKDSIVRVVKDLKRLLNITKVIVEQGSFDTYSMVMQHSLQGSEFQKPRYEGQNFRAKVLWRDGYTCQRCGGKKRLHAHHIYPQARQGTNTPENGITLCEGCHKALHAGLWTLDKQPRTFIYPAQLQIGKWYLYQHLVDLGMDTWRCFGWMTASWRKQLSLEKSHIHDAVSMVCRDYMPQWMCKPYRIIPKRRKLWENNPTRKAEEKEGFRHWDLIKATHRTKGVVLGSVRSLKAKEITLRTAWHDNFPVAYTKSRLLWRFKSIVYI